MKVQSLLLSAAVGFLAIGITIYCYNNIVIPKICTQTENEIRIQIDENAMPKRKVAVVSDKDGISRYTVITDNIIKNKIQFIDIPEKYVAKNAVFDLDLIRGKITKEDLRYKEQIIYDSMSEDTKWFGDYDRLKDYKISDIVAGELKSGNIIDVVINYGDGSYDVVVPKIKVHKVINLNKTDDEIDYFDDDDEYIIILAVNEEQYEELELAGQLGKFETRLYLDESQPESLKTFNIKEALEKLEQNKDEENNEM